MTKLYYQIPSPLGKPILDLLEIEYQTNCIGTIWNLEKYRGWSFNLLNAVKYLWRLGQKDPDYRSDLKKAIEYLEWELLDCSRGCDNYTYLQQQIEIAIDECKALLESYENTQI